ncbi:MAG: zinc-binding alcohol dehydrogenase family protein [Alphaproteobacteria bacterium]|nr:zinc-binding alcohol dehydrogenase family protein [Alphaproteobacteria bacterium]MBU0805185.1 zinc-binding alcohol dehydrogenase family protein [Alphaproteobacteria bacterium]MBU0870684.1 zinc-binding alcohol dehydrogenase family protein [Alphaproteobacteria bacterium]MBU1401641.1 zinc-binding alcohol dehydrogenase family protein [Alphaproteobacteria bacterium]MBU1591942.1 zinc-binding alcohol dehydrogenase family protein [Alphaproteobacteria bacterium]
MKAVGYRTPGPLDREDALIDFEIDRPTATGRDLLVRVRAVSVNPVDYKIRMNRPPEGDAPAILGWDAVGEVVETGDKATMFKPGDNVWYAGAIDRSGTNAEYHLVDERIVGNKPESATNAEAAALPLTTLTAYEMLFDRLRVNDPVPGAAKAVLIIGGSGGVGSIAIQLLRALTDLTVIATASRGKTKAWVSELGAHHVIDHSKPLPPQVEALGLGQPGYVFSTNRTDLYIGQVAELIAPQGRFGLIDDPDTLDVSPFKRKSVSTHWELMYTRSLFQTPDMGKQGEILNEVAALLDAGKIRSTATDVLGAVTAANLKRAHAQLETGTAHGKLVLEGF